MSPPLPSSTRLLLWGSIPKVLLQRPSVRVPPARFIIPLQPTLSHASPSPPSPADAPSPGRAQTQPDPNSLLEGGSPVPMQKLGWEPGCAPCSQQPFPSPRLPTSASKEGGSGLGRIGGARGVGYHPNGSSPPPQDADRPAETARPRPLRAHGRPHGGRAGPTGRGAGPGAPQERHR